MCTLYFTDHNESFWLNNKENNQLYILNFKNKTMFQSFELNQTWPGNKILLVGYHICLNTIILLKNMLSITYYACVSGPCKHKQPINNKQGNYNSLTHKKI